MDGTAVPERRESEGEERERARERVGGTAEPERTRRLGSLHPVAPFCLPTTWPRRPERRAVLASRATPAFLFPELFAGTN